MKLLLRLLIYVIAILLLSACAGTWKFQEDGLNVKQKTLDNKIAVIEQMEGRWSPKIKIFNHIDLNIYKKQGGVQTRWLDAYTPTRVETPPGKIILGSILHSGGSNSYSYVKFIAEEDHKYLLTWICLPHPFIAVVDEKSSRIVAVDAGCQNCNWLIGTKISKDTECVYDRPVTRYLMAHPTWSRFNQEERRWEYNPPFDEENLKFSPYSPYHDEDIRVIMLKERISQY